jgi:hypothetical protein
MLTVPIIIEIQGTRIEIISINISYSAPIIDGVHAINTVMCFFDPSPNFNIN